MDYDSELRSHNETLFCACALRDRDRVLDIGCGTSQTTRDAARRVPYGNVLGMDIAERSIERAMALAAKECLNNVRFEQGDAQTYTLPLQRFDLAMSRYGTMFFADPVAAFRNIRQALVPSGRLVMMVWQAHERNEWSVAVHKALQSHFPESPGDQQHFSLANPAKVTQILKCAGFDSVELLDLREPVYYGSSVDEALQWVRGFRFVQEVLQRVDAKIADDVEQRLRQMLSAHLTPNGVSFDAREWIVTAKNH